MFVVLAILFVIFSIVYAIIKFGRVRQTVLPTQVTFPLAATTASGKPWITIHALLKMYAFKQMNFYRYIRYYVIFPC